MKKAAVMMILMMAATILVGCTVASQQKAVAPAAQAPPTELSEIEEVDAEQYANPQSQFLAQIMNRMIQATKKG